MSDGRPGGNACNMEKKTTFLLLLIRYPGRRLATCYHYLPLAPHDAMHSRATAITHRSSVSCHMSSPRNRYTD